MGLLGQEKYLVICAIYRYNFYTGSLRLTGSGFPIRRQKRGQFVKLSGAGISADQAVGLTDGELCQIPEIAKQIKDGEKQVKEYGKKLEQKYGNLRLQKFVVVALGFERVSYRKI